jgi:hypothetical protein
MDSISPFVLSEWNEGGFMGNFMGFFAILAKLQKGRNLGKVMVEVVFGRFLKKKRFFTKVFFKNKCVFVGFSREKCR